MRMTRTPVPAQPARSSHLDENCEALMQQRHDEIMKAIQGKFWRSDVPLETRQRHDTVLNAILENNWASSRDADVAAFSKVLHADTSSATKQRFCRMILARLYYPQMPDRSQNIPTAHRDTFEWLFDKHHKPTMSSSSSNFSEWIREEDSSLYWITGKPGAGKSTLMKFIFQDSRLHDGLAEWASEKPLTAAAFYLWNSGSLVQMSYLGLLQSLLYQSLKACDQDLLIDVLHERWEQFVAFGGGRDEFQLPELQRAFQNTIADKSRRFFFLIDGLDEFDGEPKEIISMVLRAAQPNVKLCVASRPWLDFEDAFEERPSLLLEDLTKHDIDLYVARHFNQNRRFLELKEERPEAAVQLLDDIVQKATGVFLWVVLVVDSLLEGLSNSDRLPNLEARLNALPADLEALFDKLLFRLQPQYFKEACETFRLLRTYRDMTRSSLGDGNPTLLSLYLADEPDTNTSIRLPIERLDAAIAVRFSEDMRRRLNARCKGFIEVQLKDSKKGHGDKKVGYLHRTARDFVESESYWPTVLGNTDRPSFDTEERWANAFLWLQKAYPFIDSTKLCTRMCIDSAVRKQRKTGVVQKTYLDHLIRAQYEHIYSHDSSLTTRTYLDFAASLLVNAPELSAYLACAKEEAREESKRASKRRKWFAKFRPAPALPLCE